MSAPRFQTVLKLVAGESSIPLMRLVWGEPVANFTVGTEGNWRVRAPGVESRHVTFAFDGRQLFVAAAPGRRDTFLAGAPIDERWWPVQMPVELRFGGAALHITAQQYSVRPPAAGSEPPAAGPAIPKETVLDGVGAWSAVHTDDAIGLERTQLPGPAARPAPQVQVQGPIEIKNAVMDARTVLSPQAPLAHPPPQGPAQGNVHPGQLNLSPTGAAPPGEGDPQTIRRPLTPKPPGPKDLRDRHVGVSPWYIESGPKPPAGAPAPSPPVDKGGAVLGRVPDAGPSAAAAAPAPVALPEAAPPFVAPAAGPVPGPYGGRTAVAQSPFAGAPPMAPLVPDPLAPRAISESSAPPRITPPPVVNKGLAAAWGSLSPVKKAIALLLPVALVAVLWPETQEAPTQRSASAPTAPSAIARAAASGAATANPASEATSAGATAVPRATAPAAPTTVPTPAIGAAAPSPTGAAPSASARAAAGTPSAVSSGIAKAAAALERRALDAAFEGRFADAAGLYDEIAAARPDEPVFREAARILRERNSRPH